MHIRIFFALIFFTCFLGLSFGHAATQKKINKIYGPDGKPKYVGIVEPMDKDYGRDVMTGGGIVVNKIEKTKTLEEREHDQRLARLKADEDKIIARQKIYDTALLNTYHSKTDLMIAIKKKFEAFDTQNQVLEGNLTRLKQALDAQQKDAAALERDGQKVPEKLLKDIKSTQNQIQEMQKAILTQKEKQELIKKADEADIARFLFLTQSHEIKATEPELPVSRKPTSWVCFTVRMMSIATRPGKSARSLSIIIPRHRRMCLTMC